VRRLLSTLILLTATGVAVPAATAFAATSAGPVGPQKFGVRLLDVAPARETGGVNIIELARVGMRIYLAVGPGGAPPDHFRHHLPDRPPVGQRPPRDRGPRR
jgi:hypothetical protein